MRRLNYIHLKLKPIIVMNIQLSTITDIIIQLFNVQR